MSEEHTSDQAAFRPFSWLTKSDSPSADALAEASQDIGNGIQLVLQMIEHSNISDDFVESPLLDKVQRSGLLRLAMASAGLLSDAAERHIRWVNENHNRPLASAD